MLTVLLRRVVFGSALEAVLSWPGRIPAPATAGPDAYEKGDPIQGPIRSEIRRSHPTDSENRHDRGMRKFNTSGPIVPEDHYCIPPLDRMDLRRVLELIADKRYFIVHAPRQTGKTSSLLALQDLLNSGSEGNYRCLYTNFEAGGPARENIHEAMRAILNDIGSRAQSVLGDDYVNRTKGMSLEAGGPFGALVDLLNRWSEDDSRPVVLLIDEIDSLEGDTLLSVLRQLRSGYDRHPASFPQSIVLCGVRNLRDYKIHARSEITSVTGGSAFNISAGSLRLGDFSEDDVRTLLAQHTSATGQRFLPEAIQRIWTQTSGQPWLVNALCNKGLL